MERNTKFALLGVLLDEICDDDAFDMFAQQWRIINNSGGNASLAILEGNERQRHFKIGHNLHMDDWITKYLDYDFHRRYRMRKSTFFELMRVLSPHYPVKMNRGDTPAIDLPKALAVTLCYLGTRSSMNNIGDTFGIAESSVYKELNIIVTNLVSLAHKFIVWPSEADSAVVRRQFEELAGYPGVIGAIDGSYIQILAPKADQAAYTDRKMNHSINLQGICTATKIFTNISVGTPGSRNDCRALALSSFYKKVKDQGSHSLFYNDFNHLLGDKIYPNRTWLLAPYKDYGNLTRVQRKHNYIHSATRVVIENTFGLLKGRWRCLQGLILKDIGKCSDFVAACCVLHNFCLLHNDDVINEMVNDEQMRVPQQLGIYEDNVSKRLGDEKRNRIASTF